MVSDRFFLNLLSSLEEPAVVEILRPINLEFCNEWTIYFRWNTRAAKLRISFEEEYAKIQYLRMSPQGHGYGTFLVQKLLDKLYIEGIKFVILVPKNERAATFWRKFGFYQSEVNHLNQTEVYSLSLIC